MTHPLDQPIPAIGGPAHGSLYSHQGVRLEVPTHRGDMGPMHIKTHGYRREAFCVSWGSLTLTGDAWVLDDIKDPNEVAAQTVGILIGSALRHPFVEGAP